MQSAGHLYRHLSRDATGYSMWRSRNQEEFSYLQKTSPELFQIAMYIGIWIYMYHPIRHCQGLWLLNAGHQQSFTIGYFINYIYVTMYLPKCNWCPRSIYLVFGNVFLYQEYILMICTYIYELMWSGGWSTGTVGWLSTVSTWMGDPRWIPSAWFHFLSRQTWYSGLRRIVLMANQCWYHPKHSNQARME